MSYEITVQMLQPRNAAVIHFRCAPHEMGGRLGEVLPRVLQCAQTQGVEVTGPPFTRYLAMDNWGFELQAGVPLAAPITGEADVEPLTLPGGEAAVTWHTGHYDRLGNAFDALRTWRVEHGYAPDTWGSWEVYWTDPGREPNPETWRTEVVWPLQ